MLRAKLGHRIPAGIEQHEQGADVMPGGDGEELVEAPAKSGRVLLPEQIVEEHAHGVHPEGFGPAELLVDFCGIESRLLPHLQFVDGILRDEIAAREPRLLGVPVVCLLLGPSLRGLDWDLGWGWGAIGSEHDDDYANECRFDDFQGKTSARSYIPEAQH